MTMRLERILFPFDYSDRCRSVAPVVRSLVQRTGARLTIINVLADPSAEYPASTAFLIPPIEYENMLAFGTNHLRQIAAEAFPDCVVDVVCKMGDAAKQIVCVANEMDLIMMPTRGPGKFRRLLLGSITAKVLDDATCPVWTDTNVGDQKHPQEKNQPREFSARNILCAVDAKNESESLIRHAAELAGLYSGKIHLVHALPELDGTFKELRPELARNYRKTAMEKIAALRDRAGVSAEIRIEEGSVSEVIRATALESFSDLIVIGRGHLHGFLGRLRTNVYAIIRDSPCPVLSF